MKTEHFVSNRLETRPQRLYVKLIVACRTVPFVVHHRRMEFKNPLQPLYDTPSTEAMEAKVILFHVVFYRNLSL